MEDPYKTPSSTSLGKEAGYAPLRAIDKVCLVAYFLNILIPVFLGVSIIALIVNAIAMIFCIFGVMKSSRIISIATLLYFSLEFVLLMAAGSPGNYVFFCLVMLAISVLWVSELFSKK